MKKIHRLILGISLRYGHFSVNKILSSGVFDGGFTRCNMQSSMVLIFDAPSESKAICHSPREDIFTFIPDNDARNVITGCHLQIAWKEIPVPIILYITMNKFKGGRMGADSR
jgi:hypothetical protein